MYKVGELPHFEVSITNLTKKDIYLIGGLDGSNVKGRFPHCYFSIQKPQPDSIPLFFCGTFNTLTAADFVPLKAGASFNPYGKYNDHFFFEDPMATLPDSFRQPGVYTIRFYYSTRSADISDYEPSSDERSQLSSLFKKMPKVELVSNELSIRLEE